MAVINDPETRVVLRDLGCLTQDELNTGAFADLLAERLESDHIAASLADVGAVEATVGQLVQALTGREDEQLIELVKPLLASTAEGRVQKALSDGYVLCAGRVTIEINVNGERVRRPIGTRFLSADHEVIDRYVLQARKKRADTFVENTLALTDLVERRQPGMTQRVGSFREQLTISWNRLMSPADNK
jgi:hypothetical protein